jgi:carbon storage regulator
MRIMEGKGMLVLSRKLGERLYIGNDVTIDVLEVRGNRVKLGIAAPPGTPVHRQEIQEKIECSVVSMPPINSCGYCTG